MSKAKYKTSMRSIVFATQKQSISSNLKHKAQQNGRGKVRAMLYYKNLWTIPQVYKSWAAKPLG